MVVLSFILSRHYLSFSLYVVEDFEMQDCSMMLTASNLILITCVCSYPTYSRQGLPSREGAIQKYSQVESNLIRRLTTIELGSVLNDLSVFLFSMLTELHGPKVIENHLSSFSTCWLLLMLHLVML